MKLIAISTTALLLLAGFAHAQQSLIPGQATITVKKTASCGCCAAWVDRLKKSGFSVVPEDMAMGPVSYTHLTLPTIYSV